MELRPLTSAEDFATYDRWVKGHPQGTLWQSLEWKTFQEALGRRVKVYAGLEGGRIVGSALVVIDRTAFGLSTWDIPRGPLSVVSDQRSPSSAEATEGGAVSDDQPSIRLLAMVEKDARQSKCMTLFLSATTPLPLEGRGWGRGARHEQPEATRVVDLTLPEDQLLAQMKPKGRYNISVARKNGVRVEESKDVDAFVQLVRLTAGRDGFTALPDATYRAFSEQLPGSFLLLASMPASERPAGSPPENRASSSVRPAASRRVSGGASERPVSAFENTRAVLRSMSVPTGIENAFPPPSVTLMPPRSSRSPVAL